MQVGAVEVLHHHVRRAVVERADVDDADDVLALQGHHGARLAQEAVDGLGRLGGVLAQELDGDLLPELRVARGHDDAHAAHAEHPLDDELPADHVAGAGDAFQALVGRVGRVGRHADTIPGKRALFESHRTLPASP